MRRVQACSLGFIDEAPVRVVEEVRVPAAPEAVFEALNDPAAIASWWRGASRVRWHTPAPYGVGAVRTISPGRGLVLEETFIAWVPGELWAGTITAASVPLFASYVIRADLAPVGTETQLTWTSAVEPSVMGRLAGPLFPRIVRRTIRRGLAGLPSHFTSGA